MSDIQIIAAFLIFSYAFFYKIHLLRIDMPTVRMYGSFLSIINVIKVAIMCQVIPLFFPDFWTNLLKIFSYIEANKLLAVWWEDSFYVLPYLIVSPVILGMRNKKLKLLSVALVSSMFVLTTLHFASGHLYQGKAGWLTAIYPVVSYVVGSKKGLGTMMVLHIIFDFSMFMGVWVAIQLTGMLG